MNFAFASELTRFVGVANAARWRRTYYHRSMLHEFGHALGLEHEHYHSDCQTDLDIEAAVALFMQTDGWAEHVARFAVSAEEGLDRMRKEGYALSQSPSLDRASVMMYPLPPSVLRSGRRSPCMSTGPGRFNDGSRYAVSLSPGDILTFRAAYDRPLPRRPRQPR
jgi:hypothetical protein